MSDKDNEIKELKERLEKLEESNPKEQKEDETKPGCMNGILIFLLVMLGFSYFFSDDSETSPDEAKGQSGDPISLKLTCKLNPNAMYEDRITFNGDMTTATLESTNKNSSFNVIKRYPAEPVKPTIHFNLSKLLAVFSNKCSSSCVTKNASIFFFRITSLRFETLLI